MNKIIEDLGKIGIVPVIKIDDAKDAKPLANALIKVFDDGWNVVGIDSNKTWYKRRDTMEMLKSGNYDTGEDAQAADAQTEDAQSEEMGEW